MKLKHDISGALPYLLGLCLILTAVHANAAGTPDVGFFDSILHRYSQAAKGWRDVIHDAATRLFWTLAVISMVWTFGMMALRKADIGEFFAEMLRFIMFVGFYFWLLENGPKFADSLMKSLSKLGSKAGGLPLYDDKFGLSPSEIVQMGFEIFSKIVDNISVWPTKLATSLAAMLMGLGILMVLVVIAVNMLMLIISAWILAYAGIFFLGFGGSRWTSDMAINYFKTVLGMAVQILAMLLLLSVGKTFLEQYYASLGGEADTGNLKPMAALLVCCVILMSLVSKIPPLLAGIINGSSVGGGGIGNTLGIATLASAATMAASAAVSAVSGGASAAASGVSNAMGGANALFSAFKGAQSNVANGTDIASRMTGMLGGGGGGGGGGGDSGSSGGGGGGSTPLGSAMGVAGASSGGSEGGGMMSAAAMGGGGSESGSDSGSGGGDSGGGPSSSDSSSGGSQSTGAASLAKAGNGGDGSGAKSGSDAKGGGSRMSTAGRVALDTGANLVSGMARMAQARSSQTLGGRLAAEIAQATTSGNSNKGSSSKSFDPGDEVAQFRDSKQDKV